MYFEQKTLKYYLFFRVPYGYNRLISYPKLLATLTKRQKEILEYIKVYTQINGYAPSLEDIKNHFQLSAISTVHEHIQNLKNKGYIHKEINQARSLRPIDTRYNGEDFIEIPLLGQLEENGKIEPINNEQTFIVNKAVIKDKGSYFAIKLIDSCIFDDKLSGDITVVIKETDEMPNKDESLVIATIAKNTVTIGRLINQKGNEHIISDTKNKTVYKKFIVKGVVAAIIKSYQ